MTYGHDPNAIVGYRPQPLAIPMPIMAQMPPQQPDAPEAGLVQVLWRRKWIVLFVMTLAVIGGLAYLKKAPRMYTPEAKLAVEPTAAAINSAGGEGLTESFLYQQVGRMTSAKFLDETIKTHQLHKLESLQGNALLTLKGGLLIEVGKRDNLITVGFESMYPEEASRIVNTVVDAYMADVAFRKLNVQNKVLEIMQEKHKEVQTEFKEVESALAKFLQENPSINVDEAKSGGVFQRLQILNTELTTARIEEMRAGIAYQNAPSAVLKRQWEASKQRVTELEALLAEAEAEASKLSVRVRDFTRLQTRFNRLDEMGRELERRISEQMMKMEENNQVASVEVLEFAPTDGIAGVRVSPQKSKVLAIALAAGLVLGMSLGLLRDWMDQRLRSAEEVMATLGVAVLGTIPHMSRRLTHVQRGQKVFLDPMSDVAEAYRTVRTAVYFGARSDRSKTLLITSAMPGDGKSTSASNLAIAMAQAGQRTLLLDCDFRKPTQHTIFEVDDSIGVSTVLAGREPLEKAIQRTAIEGLDLLPGGPIPLNPSEILNSQAFSDMVDELAVKYDHIVIDSPPVNAVTDARILAALCDVTVVVLRAEKTTRKHSEYARDALNSVGARLLGCIVNDVSRGKSKSGFYSGYGYYGQAVNAVNITGGGVRPSVAPRRLIRSSEVDE
jgi:capsular exopolysaccharide synthesis family protein